MLDQRPFPYQDCYFVYGDLYCTVTTTDHHDPIHRGPTICMTSKLVDSRERYEILFM